MCGSRRLAGVVASLLAEHECPGSHHAIPKCDGLESEVEAGIVAAMVSVCVDEETCVAEIGELT